MAITTEYRLYAMEFDTVVIPALDNASITTEADVERDILSGSVFPVAARLRVRNVGLEFSTKAIRLMLEEIGSAGGKCTTNITTLYLAEFDCGRVKTVGANHIKYEIDSGMVALRNLSANHNEDATLSVSVLGVATGGNAPLKKTSGAALPTITVAAQERYGMAKTTINGVLLTAKRSINVDFGVQLNSEGSDSEGWDSLATSAGALPTLSFGGVDPHWYSDGLVGGTGLGIPFEGIQVTHANTDFYLRQKDTALATAAHIRFQTAGPAHFTNPVTANGRELATSELRIDAIEDAGNEAVFFTTDQAIP